MILTIPPLGSRSFIFIYEGVVGIEKAAVTERFPKLRELQ